MKNPFASFPKTPPARILLYGDAGTEKTRRCLSQLPGPIAYVDMESGGAYYADLPPAGSGYMLTRSAADVREALDYLGTPEGARLYRSVVIDPIGIVWDQLQEAHKIRAAERGRRKNPGMTPDDVLMDVSAWGKVKTQHGSLITRALNLSQHVVFIARGADQINEKGDVIGYKAACEKSIPFLVSTVIQTRHGFDVVEKDRSGALCEGRQARVNLSAIVGASGTAAPRLLGEDASAARDAAREAADSPAASGPALPGGSAVRPDGPDAHAAAVERAVAHLNGKGLLSDAEAHVQRSASDWTPEDLDAIRAWIREHAPAAR